MPAAYSPGLRHVAPSSYAYLQQPGWGWNNTGLVVHGDQAVMIDTCYTLELTRKLLDAVERELPCAGVSHLVLTHGNGDHAFGASLLPAARLVTSAGTAASFDHEVTPQMMTWLATQCPDEATRAYTVTHFGAFDFDGAGLREPDETFSGRLELMIGPVVVELIEVGPAHTDGDVIVHVPEDGVVYTGDILFIGDHPVVWSSLSGVVSACDRILQTSATIMVPGHGPLVGREEVSQLRGYYEYLLTEAQRRFDAGMPYQVAARDIAVPAGFEDWGLPERMVITLEAAYRNFGAEPEPMPTVLGHAARAAR